MFLKDTYQTLDVRSFVLYLKLKIPMKAKGWLTIWALEHHLKGEHKLKRTVLQYCILPEYRLADMHLSKALCRL